MKNQLAERQAKHREEALKAFLSIKRATRLYKPMSDKVKSYFLMLALLLFIIIVAWIFLK